MSIFFTADTHFGAERSLKLSLRPFETVKEMDNVLIDNWNKKVKASDIVYHLGDFGAYDTIKKLNGKIVLILGNYELKEMRDNFENNFNLYRSYLIGLRFVDVIENSLEVDLLGQKSI